MDGAYARTAQPVARSRSNKLCIVPTGSGRQCFGSACPSAISRKPYLFDRRRQLDVEERRPRGRIARRPLRHDRRDRVSGVRFSRLDRARAPRPFRSELDACVDASPLAAVVARRLAGALSTGARTLSLGKDRTWLGHDIAPRGRYARPVDVRASFKRFGNCNAGAGRIGGFRLALIYLRRSSAEAWVRRLRLNVATKCPSLSIK